jgi:hypothetical protein
MAAQFTLRDSKGRQHIAIKTGGRTDSGGDDVASALMQYVAGSPSYKLLDGRELSYRLESDQFEIIETGEVLMRTLP